MTRKPIVLGNSKEKAANIKNYNKRLKVIMSVLTLAGLVVTSLFFYSIWNKENSAIESRLETFTELRHATLLRFVNSLSQETELWATQESITTEAARYFAIWERLPSHDRAMLRHQYIDGNENTKPSDMYSAYVNHHSKHQKNRAAFMNHHGYYDVFYFNLEGDLVYTVEKEDDYGRNFNEGELYADSGLGQVFRTARDSEKGTSVFYDFTPYAPSNDAPASFLAAPMFDARGTKIGVYAIQISIEEFDEVLNYSSGLGKTGETYVVGQDMLMRNNSRLSDTPSLLVQKVDTPAVRAALAGKTVMMKGRGYTGKKTLIAAQPLKFNGTNWAVLTEMELSELRAPFRPYIWFYFMAIGFILAFGFIQYCLLTQKQTA